MPNHVSHKLTFSADEAECVFTACCPDGKFDFNTLIPGPPHIYHGNLSAEDHQDFPLNWNTWNNANWGTKWNAYVSTCHVDGHNAIILFDTAWSVPYPVLAAFANKFGIPFEHRYFDEGHNFWGIEEWINERGVTYRNVKRASCAEDKNALCIELKGYDPDAEEDSE